MTTDPLHFAVPATPMKSDRLAAFVEAVRGSGLLSADRMAGLDEHAAAPDADPQEIARGLVNAGWLTALQVKALWKGRGQDLFLNQYVLLEKLGEGGMGEVYKARHRRMERDVALKVIRRERLDRPDAVKRFRREIQVAAKLNHPNVVLAFDADQCGELHFFAMEFVEGANLAERVRDRGPLPVPEACDSVRQAALGLQHAHEHGMVHRDVKPSNLLLSKQGVVKVLDLGLARLHDPAEGGEPSRITQDGLVIGTPEFLAPEQARNPSAADIRADIYALGCTLYYLLAGRPPYPGGTVTERVVKHETEPLPALDRKDLPPGLLGVIHKMMAKRPDDRYATPAAVAKALEPFCPSGPGPMSSGRLPAVAAALLTGLPPPLVEPPSADDFAFPDEEPEPAAAVPAETSWFPVVAGVVGVLVLAAGGFVAWKLIK